MSTPPPRILIHAVSRVCNLRAHIDLRENRDSEQVAEIDMDGKFVHQLDGNSREGSLSRPAGVEGPSHHLVQPGFN
jgi:hypothetical protein